MILPSDNIVHVIFTFALSARFLFIFLFTREKSYPKITGNEGLTSFFDFISHFTRLMMLYGKLLNEEQYKSFGEQTECRKKAHTSQSY